MDSQVFYLRHLCFVDSFIFFQPAKPVHNLFSKWYELSRNTPFGITG